MRRNNTESIAIRERGQTRYVPKPGDIPIIDPESSRVVHADNSDSDWRNGLIALAVFGVASALIGYALGNSPQRGILIGVAAYIPLAGFTVLAVTGHLPVLAALRNERRRIVAQERIALRHYDAVEAAESNNHEQYMATITANNAISGLQQDVASLRNAIEATTRHEIPETRRTYIDADETRSEARVACGEWLRRCYTADGFNSDMVHNEDGDLKRAPWNGELRQYTDAKRLLTSGPLLTTNNGRSWRLRYPTEAEALNSLRN